jgi:hypothetical protein
MITKTDTEKFQKLYEMETGQDISSEIAFECIRNLVELLRRTYRPIKKKDYKLFTNKLTLKPYGKTTPNIYR